MVRMCQVYILIRYRFYSDISFVGTRAMDLKTRTIVGYDVFCKETSLQHSWKEGVSSFSALLLCNEAVERRLRFFCLNSILLFVLLLPSEEIEQNTRERRVVLQRMEGCNLCCGVKGIKGVRTCRYRTIVESVLRRSTPSSRSFLTWFSLMTVRLTLHCYHCYFIVIHD